MSGVSLVLHGVIAAALLGAAPSPGHGADDPPRGAAPAAEARLAEGSMRMSQAMNSRPEYTWLRQFKEAHGRDLIQRYGAHGIGIGWKREDGRKTDQLALVFYVDPTSPARQASAPPIPPAFTFTPPGADAPVELPTQVVERPAATFEAE